MSFVPNQSLEDLLCTKCEKYLSHFPIYDSLQPRGSICGRCPREDKDQRNIVYEDLAKSQRFPCCYDCNGCTEYLLPIDVPQHEEFCYFRTYECPNARSTNCVWEGLAGELLEHFETYHPILILRPEGFEVDFISNYDENCLLNDESGLFIVNRTNNSKTAKVTYNVSYIGSNIHTKDYSYKITLHCRENKSNPLVFNKKLTVKTVVKRDCIFRILNNPNIVILQVEVMKPKDETEVEKYSEVNIELLRGLECTVCFEYMLPPIQQCITGHSICSTCKPQRSECPTCKAKFKDTINITLGHLIDHIIYPCKNEDCKFTCKAKDIREHEKNCIFGPFKCPLGEYENCEAEVHYLKIYDHILNNHYENLLEMDTIHMPFEFFEGDSDEDCYIIRYNFQLFKLHYLYKEGTLNWALQLIGSQGKKIPYKFEIDVTDNSSTNRIHFRAACSPLSDKTTAFDNKNFVISLDYQQIKRMITEGLCYKVRIVSDP